MGRLDRHPRASAAAKLPDSFGRRFLLFVDTEEEFDWTAPPHRDSVGTTAIEALPEAHRRFADHGVHPAYLLTYPVADSPRCAELLGPIVRAGQCSIGAQLHPWVTPPLDEALTPANSFVGNLPPALERAKLAALTDRIERAYGDRPRIYRAGRYGIGPNSAAILEEAGYRLDVSVRALFDYRPEGGPNFLRHPVRPWWAGPGGSLLELPLTAAFTGHRRSAADRLYGVARRVPFAGALLARTGLLSRVALTPEGIPLGEAEEAIRLLLGEGVTLFSLSFHSPSLVPGHTPYVRDAADLRSFWAWWEGILALFARENVLPATPAALLDAAWSSR